MSPKGRKIGKRTPSVIPTISKHSERSTVPDKPKSIQDVQIDFSEYLDFGKEFFMDKYTKVLKRKNSNIELSKLYEYALQKWKKLQKQRKESQEETKTKSNRKRSKHSGMKDPPSKRMRILDNDDTSDVSDHNDLCEYCELPGELLLCDTCSGAYHLECLHLSKKDIPKGEWLCPLCVEESTRKPTKPKKEQKEKQEDKQEEEVCYYCGSSKTDLACEQCNKRFHLSCSFPPLKFTPDKWKCQYCQSKPVLGSIEKILFWKTVDVTVRVGDEDQVVQVKKFLAKYIDTSYWEVSWIDEFQFKAYSLQMFICFTRKYDLTKPMYLEETDTLPDTSDPIIDLKNIKEADLFNTYYIYGIKPEWLQIHRILRSLKSAGSEQYLIKWRDLPHSACSWEFKSTKYLRELCDLKKHVVVFKRNIAEAIERPHKFPNSTLRGHPYHPYTDTPDFLTKHNDLELHKYQIEGLNWIRYSCFNQTNVILADEMGLGKTIQSITFLYSLYKENISAGPFLIVAPLSTLTNWEREFEVWAPDLYVVTLSLNRENRNIIKDEDFYLLNSTSKIPNSCSKNYKFHALLVSYEGVQIESKILKSIKWPVLVLDEAHRIKNKQSKLHSVISTYHFKFKLLLTGTPLQNNLEELFHLLNFLSPKEFSCAETFLVEFKDLKKEEQIDKLHNLLGKRLLRRLKADVLTDLPFKSEVIVPIDFSPLQRNHYKVILNKNSSVLMQRGSSAYNFLNILIELKKCCNHPYLFRLDEKEEPYDPETGLHEMSHLVSGSAKMVLLEKMLIGLKKNNHRVLIFSQMTRLLDLIEEFLTHKDWKYERIDGSISLINRQAAIDRFNSKDSQSFIFLLSTRAGGLGINLASADTVIIYDSDWNPHNDIQALSRAHRIGQQKKVMIYRFVIRGSVEERILEVAKKKMMLTHLVVPSKLGKKENLSKTELDDILRFGTKQLFEDSKEEDKLEYDDEAISKLLNRDIHVNQVVESGINEFFSSFKVIDCAVKQPVKKDEEKKTTNQDSHLFWTSLLKDQRDLEMELSFGEFGKGKRLRKQIRYDEVEIKDKYGESDSDYKAEEESSSSSYQSSIEPENDDNFTPTTSAKVHHKREPKTVAPSSKPQNLNFELELSKKKMVLNKLVCFGLPNTNLQYTFKKWKMDLEPNFSLDDFKSVIRNLFISLDVNCSRFRNFVDKFPLDEIGCQSVLSRVALIELIKSKAIQYGSRLPYLIPLLLDDNLISENDLPSDYMLSVEKYINPESSSDLPLSHRVTIPANNQALVSTNSIFKFNIEDHNYTELHLVWEAEQAKREENLWWRYHDLLLFLGIAIHGYNELAYIFSDPRFYPLNLAFENRKEDKCQFARRRLDLLEQALIIEDVVKRMISSKVFLKPDSNIVKLRNKIIELNSLIESMNVIIDKYGQDDKNVSTKSIVLDILKYSYALTADIKNDCRQFNRFVLSSSVRAIQLFPKADDRMVKSSSLNNSNQLSTDAKK